MDLRLNFFEQFIIQLKSLALIAGSELRDVRMLVFSD